MLVFEIKNLSVKFEDYYALRDITDFISKGEVYCIAGNTGSGKTTLLKSMVGLVFPTAGRVELYGKNIFKFSQKEMLEYHKNCGFVFQNAALISNLSIYENLSLYYNYHTYMSEEEIYDRIKYYLDYFGFDNDLSLRPASLSMGERMILNIVRAISHEPEILFFDNPFASLDTLAQRKVTKIISEMKQKGCTIILVTNDPEYIFSLADKVVILENGAIIEKGDIKEIKNTKNEEVKNLLGI